MNNTANSLILNLVVTLSIALFITTFAKKLRIPYTVGLVIAGVFFSFFGTPLLNLTPELIFTVFLPPLLFDGAWRLNIQHILRKWRPILYFSLPGVLITASIIGVFVHFGASVPWSLALLLGAILSPTDPITVLGVMQEQKVNEDFSTIIESESLFNDGVGGSLYRALGITALSTHLNGYGYAFIPIGQWASIFIQQLGIGALVGAALGCLIILLVKYIDDPLLETAFTFVISYGAFLTAEYFNGSGIVAVVTAGLCIGTLGRRFGMHRNTITAVNSFWEQLAFLTNAVLFLLLGAHFDINTLVTNPQSLGISGVLIIACAIIATLVGRLVVCLLYGLFIRLTHQVWNKGWLVAIWGSGFRGALSLALVLSLPSTLAYRPQFIVATFAVILFTLVVHGLSIRYLLIRFNIVK